MSQYDDLLIKSLSMRKRINGTSNQSIINLVDYKIDRALFLKKGGATPESRSGEDKKVFSLRANQELLGALEIMRAVISDEFSLYAKPNLAEVLNKGTMQ